MQDNVVFFSFLTEDLQMYENQKIYATSLQCDNTLVQCNAIIIYRVFG